MTHHHFTQMQRHGTNYVTLIDTTIRMSLINVSKQYNYLFGIYTLS